MADFKPKLVEIMKGIDEKYGDEGGVHFPTGVFSNLTENVLLTTRDFFQKDFTNKPKIMVQFLDKIEEYIKDMNKKSQENEDHQILDTYCYLFKDAEHHEEFIHKLKKQFQKQLKK